MSQYNKRESFNLSNDSFYSIYNEYPKNLLLVPQQGNNSIYAIGEDTDSFCFILNEDATTRFSWIIITTHLLQFPQYTTLDGDVITLEIAELEHEGAIFNVPDSVFNQEGYCNCKLYAYLANKEDDLFKDYWNTIPCSFWIYNEQDLPSISSIVPNNNWYTFEEFPEGFKVLGVLSTQDVSEFYYCVSQGPSYVEGFG